MVEKPRPDVLTLLTIFYDLSVSHNISSQNKISLNLILATKEYLKRESASTHTWFQLGTFIIWCSAIVLRIIFVKNTPNFIQAPILDGENNPINHSETYLKVLQSYEKTPKSPKIIDAINLIKAEKDGFYGKLYNTVWFRPFRSPGHFFGPTSFYFFLFDAKLVSSLFSPGA